MFAEAAGGVGAAVAVSVVGAAVLLASPSVPHIQPSRSLLSRLFPSLQPRLLLLLLPQSGSAPALVPHPSLSSVIIKHKLVTALETIKHINHLGFEASSRLQPQFLSSYIHHAVLLGHNYILY